MTTITLVSGWLILSNIEPVPSTNVADRAIEAVMAALDSVLHPSYTIEVSGIRVSNIELVSLDDLDSLNTSADIGDIFDT